MENSERDYRHKRYFGPEFEVVAERELANESGPFGLLEIKTKNVQFNFPDRDLIKKDLQLIYGIGDVTAAKLKQTGVRTVADLLDNARWRNAAAEIVRAIETADIVRLIKYGASDLELLGFFSPGQVKFIDIETVGLYYIHPVFLVGILSFGENSEGNQSSQSKQGSKENHGFGSIRQILARNFTEEKALLQEVYNELQNTLVIISFNGRSFDLPYLKGRMKFHQLHREVETFHLDLLKQARRNYRGVLPNCRLLTIERELLNQDREEDISGAEVIDFYYRYLDTGNNDYLDPILQHNANDLLSMAKFLGLLTTNLG